MNTDLYKGCRTSRFSSRRNPRTEDWVGHGQKSWCRASKNRFVRNHPGCSTLIEPIFRYAHLVPKGSKSIRWKTLGYSICDIIGCRYLLEADLPWKDVVPNKVIPNVDMLGGIMVNWILRQNDNTLTVVVDIWSWVEPTCWNVCASRSSHKASFVTLDVTTYSASFVEVVMHSWSFDFHEIAPVANLKHYPIVDFRLSTQPTKSESV